MISTLLSVHLLTILQSCGISLTAAVGLGALVGQSQVGARTIELFIASYHHPIWTKIAAISLVGIGVTALWSSMLSSAIRNPSMGLGGPSHLRYSNAPADSGADVALSSPEQRFSRRR
jgi:hypothetical protein